jgi:voltage-gated potassium channel
VRPSRQLEIVVTALIIIGIVGTVAYHDMEHWSYVDSFYFTGVTMMTIGYGDLHPTTPMSKIFTVFFAMGGVGIALLAASLIAGSYVERREKAIEEAMSRRLLKGIRKMPRRRPKRR